MSDEPYRRLEYSLPRVLIVENDEKYRQLYCDLLGHWEFKFFTAVGVGEALLKDAEEKAFSGRCHLAIVDLRLLDEYEPEERSGLELIANLAPTRSIMVSGFPDFRLVREGLIEQGAISFVGKQEGPKKLNEELEKASKRYCVCKRDLTIDVNSSIIDFNVGFFPEEHSNIPEDEAADVLARLFPDATKLRVDPMETDKRSPTGVPRPRSFILHVYQDGLQPEVVKLARAAKIKKEVKRYNKFIEGHLVGNLSPPIQRWDALWDIGGAVYPATGARKVELFSDYYRMHRVGDIIHSLTQLFTITWSEFYDPGRRMSKLVPIFKAYSDVWDAKWFEERIRNFQPIAPQTVMPSPLRILDLPEPISWLIDRVDKSYELPLTSLAVTHGDMHGDNLLVDNNRNIWAVDFERSGVGPILQDFVELEADILTRMLGIPDDDFYSIFVLGVWVSASEEIDRLPPIPLGVDELVEKSMQVIRELRKLALRCTQVEDARQYYWGLLFNTMFRATLLNRKYHEKSQNRSLMLASIFCHRLTHWGETWPPPAWPPIT